MGSRADLIEAVVSHPSRDAELQTALLLLERRHPPRRDDDRERDRAWQMLVRRGYDAELAYDAIRAHERRGAERVAAPHGRIVPVADSGPCGSYSHVEAAGSAGARPKDEQIAPISCLT